MIRFIHFIASIFLLIILMHPASADTEGPTRDVKRIISGNPLGGAFYENRGQIVDTDGNATPDIKYYAFQRGATLYFTPTGWHTVYNVVEGEEEPVSEATGQVSRSKRDDVDLASHDRPQLKAAYPYRMDVSFVGCNEHVVIEAADPMPRYLNYYLGHCPDGITRVPAFGGLRYRNLYDNIDLVLYASTEGLKYAFEVRPGGRVGDIQLRHGGNSGIERAEDGSLRLLWPKGWTQDAAPYSFQEGADGMAVVRSSFKVEGDVVTFSIEPYDNERTLVIDPWSTYYGGSERDYLERMACDSVNALIAVGYTYSLDFPTHRALQASHPAPAPGKRVIFALRVDSLGRLAWATYYGGGGGNAQQWALGVTTDPWCDIVLVGSTSSTTFPVSSNAYQQQPTGSGDAVLVKLDSGGTRVWATYIGGDKSENLYRVTADRAGNIYAAGNADDGFPVKRAYQDSAIGGASFVYLKMKRDGSDLIFSSYWGGPGGEGIWGIGVDARGRFAFGGGTHQGIPMLNARQPVKPHTGSNSSGFVSMFDSSGVPLWSTWHGGSGGSSGRDLTMDAEGNVVMSGHTLGGGFPVLRAFQEEYGGFNDCYLSKFDQRGTLLWSTYIGSAGVDNHGKVTCDRAGNVYTAGQTSSANFPVYRAAYPTRRDTGTGTQGDTFVAGFDSAGARRWATYLGGNDSDFPQAIVCDKRGFVYVGGWTQSNNFPVFNAIQRTIGSVRNTNQGNPYWADIFITRTGSDGYIPVTLSRIAAQRVSGGVELSWRTESEVNAYGFIIERRYEQETAIPNLGWSDIGFVTSAAQGNEGRDYNYLDTDPGTTDTRIFYRLRMVDLDGTFEHSPIVEVARESGAIAVSFETAYPSPARDWLTLNFTLPVESSVGLSVHDVSGREIARVYENQSIPGGTHSIVLPVDEWRSGLYLCTLTVDGRRLVRRAMVVR